MYCDGLRTAQGADETHSPAKLVAEFERLIGTVISGIKIGDDRALEIMGSDRDGAAFWRLRVVGSARFTFSDNSASPRWLVEANFDAGGVIRRSEWEMMLALRGASVSSFTAGRDELIILSDDGRGLEVPYVLNDDGLTLEILPGNHNPIPGRIILQINPD
jgi:hypothetical protein